MNGIFQGVKGFVFEITYYLIHTLVIARNCAIFFDEIKTYKQGL